MSFSERRTFNRDSETFCMRWGIGCSDLDDDRTETSIESKEGRGRIEMEDRKVEQQLKIRKQEQLRKILAVENSIPRLVHKVNNPLVPVIGHAELLLPKNLTQRQGDVWRKRRSDRLPDLSRVEKAKKEISSTKV